MAKLLKNNLIKPIKDQQFWTEIVKEDLCMNLLGQVFV